jgi:hypothetical protein
MAKRRAVFVVGHAHWGKSRTLRALTDGLHRYVSIGTVKFFIRRMSNDDRPDEFYDFVDAIDASERPDLILAFCPTIQEQQTRTCLETLRKKGYRLYFWVLRNQYGSKAVIGPNEITTLARYGQVYVSGQGHAVDTTRAKALRLFIRNAVLI